MSKNVSCSHLPVARMKGEESQVTAWPEMKATGGDNQKQQDAISGADGVLHFFILVICLEGKVNRDSFHPLVHYSNGCKGWIWASLHCPKGVSRELDGKWSWLFCYTIAPAPCSWLFLSNIVTWSQHTELGLFLCKLAETAKVSFTLNFCSLHASSVYKKTFLILSYLLNGSLGDNFNNYGFRWLGSRERR